MDSKICLLGMLLFGVMVVLSLGIRFDVMFSWTSRIIFFNWPVKLLSVCLSCE